jgi:hypothetical protein
MCHDRLADEVLGMLLMRQPAAISNAFRAA